MKKKSSYQRLKEENRMLKAKFYKEMEMLIEQPDSPAAVLLKVRWHFNKQTENALWAGKYFTLQPSDKIQFH